MIARKKPYYALTSLLALSFSHMAMGQTTITVNASLNRHAISPNVYGTAFATQAQMADLNFALNRYGGNSSSTYNWNLNCDNRGSDWYFESIADDSAVAGERGDTFIANTKNGGGQPLITIPMIDYLGKVAADRQIEWSFSEAKYGAQTDSDPYRTDAGSGQALGSGAYITGNNPLDAGVANSVATQKAWINHMISKWGTASGNGVRYYVMDNEPSIWHATHRDFRPVGETYVDLYNDYVNYAGAVRAADPKAVIFGPEEYGWTGYFYSGYDQQYASVHGWGGPFPDRASHGNGDNIPWLLQNLKSFQDRHGAQLLNVLSVHYYPQQGEFGDDDSAGMRAIRNRSTRSLWDPNYTDTSWMNTVVKLIPRLKSWVSSFYPGLQTAITEYNWGDEGALNGATTQSDVLGIFGREGLDYSTRWTTPNTGSPTYLSMKMYRNYDGSKSTFGDTSVSCTVANPDNLSAFAAQRSSDSAMTVMVINKQTSSAPININLSGFTSNGSASVYQISSTSQTSIYHLSNVTLSGSSLLTTVPPQSVTLYVLPQSSAPQYDFEIGTQAWASSGAPITSVSSSTAQHYTGTHSLAVNFSGAAGTALANVGSPTAGPGKNVTFRIWLPTVNQITSVQPYVEQGAGGGWLWTGNYKSISQLHDGWNTVTVTVPTNAVMPLYQLGVQFTTGATWSGTCYVDSVTW